MKKQLVIISATMLVLSMGSCTKDFTDINTDPTRSTPANFDANFFLSNAENTYKEGIAGYQGPILFQAGWVQILASTSSGGANYYSNMDKYVQSSNTNTYTQSSWNNGYRAAGLANEIIKNFQGDPSKTNIVAVATIMKVLSLHYVTDVYGAGPYSEALQGGDGVSLPAYDPQQTMYTSMLSDLEAALTSIDVSKPGPTADVFSTHGDMTNWKKLGYSLMLRMTMRLAKVDAAMAQSYAEKAAAGGTLSDVSEDIYLVGDNANGYSNPNARALSTSDDYYEVRWAETFIDYLKSNDDPRLPKIAEVPQPGLAANKDMSLAGDSDPAVQMGLPNGYDLNGGATDISNSPGYPGPSGSGSDVTPIGQYSRPKTSVYTDRNTPVSIITSAESELLLAEAAARGWNVGGTAASHYAKGVSLGIQALGNISPNAAISATDADSYAAAHPLDVSSLDASLKMINEQYWATTGALMNFAEAWNNWKRSGYPVLTPVNYAGNFSNGTIPRRQIYPTNEASVNPSNYQSGVGDLSNGDNWASRVWWDAP